MQTNELARQVKELVEELEAAERSGFESCVIQVLVKLRKLLNAQPQLEDGGKVRGLKQGPG